MHEKYNLGKIFAVLNQFGKYFALHLQRGQSQRVECQFFCGFAKVHSSFRASSDCVFVRVCVGVCGVPCGITWLKYSKIMISLHRQVLLILRIYVYILVSVSMWVWETKSDSKIEMGNAQTRKLSNVNCICWQNKIQLYFFL